MLPRGVQQTLPAVVHLLKAGVWTTAKQNKCHVGAAAYLALLRQVLGHLSSAFLCRIITHLSPLQRADFSGRLLDHLGTALLFRSITHPAALA